MYNRTLGSGLRCSQPGFTDSKKQWKHQNNVWNLDKIQSKETSWIWHQAKSGIVFYSLFKLEQEKVFPLDSLS